jgi:uridine kinase
MSPSAARAAVVAQIADVVCASPAERPARVAVDGVTAAGKTTLAGELTVAVGGLGRPAIHLTMDGFHHPRAVRHRQGRRSPDGYYEDAFDVEAFARLVLVPLGPGGDRRYRERIHDLDSDETVDEPAREAPADAVLVVDGSFLQRPELFAHWDHRIFVETSLEVARERGVVRDAGLLGGRQSAEELYGERYHAACRRYLAEVDPVARATLVLRNDDVERPVLLRPLAPRRTFVR